MTVEELEEAFERCRDEYIEFGRIEKPLSPRPDVCAFLMLDAAVPPEPGKCGDMVSAAEHDEIWLDVDIKAFAAVATEELIRDLQRCGVRYDAENRSLCMFA